jgi:hypothetical protein
MMMDRSSITRRDFARTAAAAATATAAAAIVAANVVTGGEASAMSEQTEPATAPATQSSDAFAESRVRWLEEQLGRPIASAELRKKVVEQIANNDAMWKRGRKFSVPDQTEPAFEFLPVRSARGRS